MRERAREKLDMFQNLAIALLAVTAVLLLSRTQIFAQSLQAAREALRLFPGTGAPSAVEREDLLAAPVRLAATNAYGRYANVAMTTGDLKFLPVRRLLESALNVSAAAREQDGVLEESRRADFLRALNEPSLYCDFLSPLPLSLLAALLDASAPEEQPVRALVLAPEGDASALYLWDGAEGYYRRAARVTRHDLLRAVEGFEWGNGAFAMDRAEENALWRNVAPLSLFPDTLPDLPALAATGGIPDTDALLTSLGFNPLTNTRYPEANGTEVIVENGRSIRFRTDGSVWYQSGGRTDLSVESAGAEPTLWEAVSGCALVLDMILPESAVSVYVQEAAREGETLLLRFGYQTGGVPVRFSDGGCAAVAVLEGRSIVSLEVRPRSYAATDGETRVLPVAQALSIAGLDAGRELSLGYADRGGIYASAAWIAG